MPKIKLEKGVDNPILRTMSDEVSDLTMKTPRYDVKLREFVREMKEMLYDQSGLGLAAPQVGENIRAIVLRINSDTPHEMFIAMINPEIIESSWSGSSVVGEAMNASSLGSSGASSGALVGASEMKASSRASSGSAVGASSGTLSEASSGASSGTSEIRNVGKKMDIEGGIPEGAEIGEEGCLSLPRLYVNVVRARDITVRFVNGGVLLKGGTVKKGLPAKTTLKLSGLNARVVQHEIDHLNGVMICDKG